MGKESTLKAVRKQLRNIVREDHERVMASELVVSIRKELGAKVDEGLARLNKVLSDKLNEIDERSKSIQSSLVTGVLSRPLDASSGVIPLPTEPATEATPVQE